MSSVLPAVASFISLLNSPDFTLLLYSLIKLYTSLPVLNFILEKPIALSIGVIISPILVNIFSLYFISFLSIASENIVRYSSGFFCKYSSEYSLLPSESTALILRSTA